MLRWKSLSKVKIPGKNISGRIAAVSERMNFDSSWIEAQATLLTRSTRGSSCLACRSLPEKIIEKIVISRYRMSRLIMNLIAIERGFGEAE